MEEGICCPVYLAVKDSNATRAYVAALTKFKSMCSIGCPAVPCPVVMAAVCKATANGSAFTCQLP